MFLLGPSHHHYLSGCALSQCDEYETPLGNLKLDKATIAELHATKQFDKMSQSVDENEHSMEMHLPYIFKVLQKLVFPLNSPLVVHIILGHSQILQPFHRSFPSWLETLALPQKSDMARSWRLIF